MLNLSNAINWELLENAKYVIVEASNEDEGFTVSVDGIYVIDMNEETLKEAIKSKTEGLTVLTSRTKQWV